MTNDRIKVTMELSADQLHALRSALELGARIGMGQFGHVAEFMRELGHSYEQRHECNRLLKPIFYPQLQGGSYYAMHSAKTPAVSKRCWEIYAQLRHVGGDQGVYKYTPMPVIDEPQPVVEIERVSE